MARYIPTPTGKYIEIPEGMSPIDAYQRALEKYPEAFGYTRPEPPKPTVSGLGEFMRGVPYGAASMFTSGARGLAELSENIDRLRDDGHVTMAEDTALGSWAKRAQNYLDTSMIAPRNPDSWMGQLGQATGSVIGFAGTGGVGGAAAKGLAGLAGAGARALSGAATAGRLAGAGGMGAAVGLSEAGERQEAAREAGTYTGDNRGDMTADWLSAAAGASQAIPVEVLLRASPGGRIVAALTHIPGVKKALSAIPAGAPLSYKKYVIDSLAAAGKTGAAEAVQEVAEGLAYDAIEKFHYNPTAEIGQTMGADAALGGGAGALVSGLLSAMNVPKLARARNVLRQLREQDDANRAWQERYGPPAEPEANVPLLPPPAGAPPPQIEYHGPVHGDGFTMEQAPTLSPDTLDKRRAMGRAVNLDLDGPFKVRAIGRGYQVVDGSGRLASGQLGTLEEARVAAQEKNDEIRPQLKREQARLEKQRETARILTTAREAVGPTTGLSSTDFEVLRQAGVDSVAPENDLPIADKTLDAIARRVASRGFKINAPNGVGYVPRLNNAQRKAMEGAGFKADDRGAFSLSDINALLGEFTRRKVRERMQQATAHFIPEDRVGYPDQLPPGEVSYNVVPGSVPLQQTGRAAAPTPPKKAKPVYAPRPEADATSADADVLRKARKGTSPEQTQNTPAFAVVEERLDPSGAVIGRKPVEVYPDEATAIRAAARRMDDGALQRRLDNLPTSNALVQNPWTAPLQEERGRRMDAAATDVEPAAPGPGIAVRGDPRNLKRLQNLIASRAKPEDVDKALAEALADIGRRHNLKEAIKVVRHIVNPDTGQRAEGAFDAARNLIEIANSLPENMPVEEKIARLADVLHHEIVHALIASGQIGKTDYAVLRRFTQMRRRTDNGKTFYQDALDRYAGLFGKKGMGPQQIEEAVSEEAIAEAFRHWMRAPQSVPARPTTALGKIWNWLKDLLSGGRLFHDEVNGIFNAMSSGESGVRAGDQGSFVATPGTVGPGAGEKKLSLADKLKRKLNEPSAALPITRDTDTEEQARRADKLAESISPDAVVVLQKSGVGIIRVIIGDGEGAYVPFDITPGSPVNGALKSKDETGERILDMRDAFDNSGTVNDKMVAAGFGPETLSRLMEWVNYFESVNNPVLIFPDLDVVVRGHFSDGSSEFSSPNAKKIEGLTTELKSLLGIRKKIAVVEPSFIVENANMFTGRERAILSSPVLHKDTVLGSATYTSDASFIVIDNNQNIGSVVKILTHELGHIHMNEVLVSQDEATKKALFDAHAKWLESLSAKDIAEVEKEARAYEVGKHMEWESEPNSDSELMDFLTMLNGKNIVESAAEDPQHAVEYREYITSFSEWYAENVVKWANTDKKPLSIVERFFKKIADKLRSMYNLLVSRGYGPDPTFSKYMENLTKDFSVVDGVVIPPGQIIEGTATEIDIPPLPDAPRSSGSGPKYSMEAPFGQRVPALTEGELKYAFDANTADLVMDRVADSILSNRQRAVSVGEDLVTKFQDYMYPAKKLIAEMEKSGQKVSDPQNFYMKELLYHGRIGEAIRDAENRLMDPILEKLKEDFKKGANGVSFQDLEDYLLARHAKERNAYMYEHTLKAVKRGSKTVLKPIVNGSGISDAKADEIMAFLKPKMKRLEEYGKMIDAIVEATNRRRIEYGLIPPDFNDVTKYPDIPRFRNYVPLQGFLEEDIDPASITDEVRFRMQERIRNAHKALARGGGGFKVKGREDRPMTGREGRPTDILANLFMQHLDTLIRGEKNRVGNSFLDFVSEWGPKSGAVPFAEVVEVAPFRPYVDEKGIVRRTPTHTYKDRNDVLVTKVAGRDVAIKINDYNIARAMNHLYRTGQSPADAPFRFLGWVNRNLARLATQWNPEFILVNLIRDFGTASLVAQRWGLSTRTFVRTYMQSAPAIFSEIWQMHRGGEPVGEWGRLFDEMRKHGGTTEYLGLNTLEEQLKKIDSVLKNMPGGPITGMKKAIEVLGSTVESANFVAENISRLVAYKLARDKGMNPDAAAAVAKQITVNFNKGGELKSVMNSLFLFYNASLQGTVAIGTAIATSPKLQKMLGGILIAGFLMDMLNAIMSGDDDDGVKHYDKISDWELEHNFIFPTFGVSEDAFVKVPMPFLFNSIYNAGRAMGQYFRSQNGYKMPKPLEATSVGAGIVGAIVESTNPLGGTESFLNFVAPTIVDPFVDFTRNRDPFGRPIKPEQSPFGRAPKPESQLYWNNTTPEFVKISQWLNKITGGTDTISGAVDVSPAAVDYWFGFVTGATGKFAQRTWSMFTHYLPETVSTGEVEFSANDIPFARRFVARGGERRNLEMYFDVVREAGIARASMKAAIEARDPQAMAEYRERFGDIMPIVNPILKMDAQINRLRGELRKLRRNETMDPENRKRRMESLEERINVLTGRVNRLYVDATTD